MFFIIRKIIVQKIVWKSMSYLRKGEKQDEKD